MRHPRTSNHLYSTRNNSTTMDPIQEANEEIELREADDDFSYRQIAKK
jgi:hypothetical protein